MAPPTRPEIVRFNEKWTEQEMGYQTPCWMWTAWVDKDGYAGFRSKIGRRAARFAYHHHKGAIPDGITVDHLCNVTRCVNPDHLVLATSAANALRGNGPLAVNARKTQCIRGHPFDATNTYEWRGQRKCRQCKADYSKARAA
jgi:hypothetical protein